MKSSSDAVNTAGEDYHKQIDQSEEKQILEFDGGDNFERVDKREEKNPSRANCLMHIHTLSCSGMWLWVKLTMTLQPEMTCF